MIKAFILNCLIIFFIGSCEKSGEADYLITDANLQNSIAVDGCEWHFGVNQKAEIIQFAASDASKPILDAFINSIQSSAHGVFNVDVKLTYKLTGKEKDVQCGWGKKTAMTEIEIKEITNR